MITAGSFRKNKRVCFQKITNNAIINTILIILFIFIIGYFLEKTAESIESIEYIFLVFGELLTIFFSFSIFTMTWLAYHRSKDSHAIFMGAAFFVIGLADFFHMLSHPVMPDIITLNSSHKSEIFWFFARFISASLFLTSVFIYRDTPPRWINKLTLMILIIVPGLAIMILLLDYHDHISIIEYSDGSFSMAAGLTLIISSAVILFSAHLYKKRIEKTGEMNLIFIPYGLIFIVTSDLVNLFYDISGHMLRGTGSYLIFHALYRSSVEKPYIDLANAEDALRQSYDVQSVINSLLNFTLEDKSLDDIFKGTLDRIFTIPWLAVESRGSIYLADDEHDVLVMKTQIGLDETIQKQCARIPFGRCLCGRAASTQKIQFADCVDERHEIVYPGLEPHGHYCVPIISTGKILGVMNLYLGKGHQVNRHDEIFLTSVADTLAGIIKRKKAENTLRESEERHRRLVDFSPFGIAIHSEGKIVFVNLAGAKILGAAKPDDLIGKPILEVVHYNYHDIVKNRIIKQEQGEIAPLIEEKFIRLDGTEVDVEIMAIPFNYKGRLAMYGVFQEITERKAAEEVKLKNLRLESANKAKSEFLQV